MKKLLGPLSIEVSTNAVLLSIPTSPVSPQLRLCWIYTVFGRLVNEYLLLHN